MRLTSFLFHRLPVRAVLFALIYFLTALLSRAFSFPAASFATLWLPGGLMTACLLLTPLRDWPVYLLAALPTHLLHYPLYGHPMSLSLLFFFSSSLESVTGAWLVRRFSGGSQLRFNKPGDVLTLVLFAVTLSPAVAATLYTMLLIMFSRTVTFWDTLRIVWIGHGLGVLALTPVILSWASYRFEPRHFSNIEKLLELALLFTGLVVSSLFVFGGNGLFLGKGYLVIPFLVWAGLRFGPRVTTLAGLIFTLIVVWGAVWQLGAFAVNDITIVPTMDTLGSFLAIILITCFMLMTNSEVNQRIAEELRKSEERYRMLIEHQGEGIVMVDQHEAFVLSNPAADQIFGVAPHSLVGRNVEEFTNPTQFERILQQTKLRRQGLKSTYEAEIQQPNGVQRSVLITATPEVDEEGKLNRSFAVFHDITERKQAERALSESRARYQALFDHSPIPIWEQDFSGIKRMLDGLLEHGVRDERGVQDLRAYFNANPQQLLNCLHLLQVLDVNEATLQLFHFEDKSSFLSQVRAMMEAGPQELFLEQVLAIAEGQLEFDREGPNGILDGVIRHHHVRWSVAPGYEQNYSRVITSIIDVTERKRTEERLRYLSTHDVLTGLYNRNFFEVELERLQNGRQHPVNIMVVDVNRMKGTNNSYGHAAGDDLLRRTAQVLKTSFRREDIIARIGGDEFAVLFAGEVDNLESVRRVKAFLEEHNSWYEGEALSLSIGAAVGVKGSDLSEVLKKADQQMYLDKVRSKGSHPF